MLRLLSNLLFVWALLVGPALCMGGMLEHDCECGHEAQCEHEESCAGDPCETLARPNGLDLEQCLDLAALSVPAEWPGMRAQLDDRRRPLNWRVIIPPDREPWPYVERNRLLLI